MRSSVLFFAFAALDVWAFDSGEWMSKREMLTREAERLQAACAVCAAHLETPAENVLLPVETHPDGSVKTSIFAKRAQIFLDSGLVWGSDVVVRQLATNGTVEAEIEAGRCVVDRGTKSGWIEGHAAARYLANEMEGDGVYFSFPEEFVIISSNTQIRIKGQKIGSSSLFAAGSGGKDRAGDAQITARRTDFDRKEGVVLFEGGVRATDAESGIGADRIFVFLNGTNALRRIVADGGVTVTNGVRSGSCARAAYAKAAGRVVMYGDGDVPARLQEGARRQSVVEGRRITFWLDSEQVEVEGAAITLDGASSGGKSDILRRIGK